MVKLGDICTVVSGSTPSSSVAEYWDGNHIWITPAELSDDSFIIYDSVRHITDRAIQETSLKPFPEGTVILSSRAPIGKTAIAGCKMYCNQGFKNLICSDSIYNKYLCFFLSAKTDYLNSLGRGATFKEISKYIVENIQIYLPTIEEQKKRAGILEKLMFLIQTRKKQLSKLNQLVKSRFIEMFGDTKNNINNFKIYSIGDICSLKSGTSLPLNVENEGGDIPYIKVSDMSLPGNERYITISSRYVTQKTAGKGIFPVGSVIFPKRGGAIGTNKKRLTQIPICADLNIMGVIPGANIMPQYLLSYFDMIDLGKLDNGSSVPQLNNKDIAPLKILLPPLSLQEQFAAFVEQVEKAKSSVKQSLEKLETLKKSLMQEYFG